MTEEIIGKKTYPDGTTYCDLLGFGYPEFLTVRINSYNDLWYLAQLRDAYKSVGCNANITIPWLLDGQADDRFGDGQSFNLKLICEFINQMKWLTVSIFHPHNSQLVKGLIDNVIIRDNTEFIMQALDRISPAGNSRKNFVLMSPDAGAYKWIMKLADKINWHGEVECASKSREFKEGKSILTQSIGRQDFEGKDIIILDDLSIFAGTFVGLAKILRQRNAGNLYLIVSHITVPNPNKELEELYTGIFTTNSKGLQYDLKNLEVINLFID